MFREKIKELLAQKEGKRALINEKTNEMRQLLSNEDATDEDLTRAKSLRSEIEAAEKEVRVLKMTLSFTVKQLRVIQLQILISVPKITRTKMKKNVISTHIFTKNIVMVLLELLLQTRALLFLNQSFTIPKMKLKQ